MLFSLQGGTIIRKLFRQFIHGALQFARFARERPAPNTFFHTAGSMAVGERGKFSYSMIRLLAQ